MQQPFIEEGINRHKHTVFLGQTGPTKDVNTSTSAIHREQLKEKIPEIKPMHWQGSKIKAVTRTTTNVTDASKNTTPVAVPLVPPSTSDSSVSTVASSQTPKEEEISVSDEAKKAGQSLKELIMAAIRAAKDSTKEQESG